MMKNFRRETSPTPIAARQGFKTPRRQRGEFLSLNIWKNCLEPVKLLSYEEGKNVVFCSWCVQ